MLTSKKNYFVALKLRRSSLCDEQQVQLHDTSVSFIKNPEKSLYKDIRPTQQDQHGERYEVEEC